MFGRRSVFGRRGEELSGHEDEPMMEMPDAAEGQGTEGMVVLEDSAGKHRIVWATKLAEALIDRGVGMVVLNTCESGQRQGGSLFEWSGLAAALLENGMPAVVGMQQKISDLAAHAFTRGFYTNLAFGGGLDEAVAMARRNIMDLTPTDNGDHEDWGVPVLYLRSPDGVVFTAKPPTSGVAPQRASKKRKVAKKATQKKAPKKPTKPTKKKAAVKKAPKKPAK